ncbi:response regulator transcription factor [Dictyobacter halimunensis]
MDKQRSELDSIQGSRYLEGKEWYPAVPAPIRVLVVDDHEVVRTGISASLAAEPDFSVVGEAAEGGVAIAMAQKLHPDIVLLDVILRGIDGLDIAQQMLRTCPEVRVVIFTGCFDDESLFRAFRIGAHGYLQKSLPIRGVLAALRAVQQGERVLMDSHTLSQLLDEFGRISRNQVRTLSGLSEIEIEIVRMVGDGYTNKEIALQRFWSEVTVKRKLQEIYRKLQVSDRAQAVAEALRMGLI